MAEISTLLFDIIAAAILLTVALLGTCPPIFYKHVPTLQTLNLTTSELRTTIRIAPHTSCLSNSSKIVWTCVFGADVKHLSPSRPSCPYKTFKLGLRFNPCVFAL